jgi:hypothetical protein
MKTSRQCLLFGTDPIDVKLDSMTLRTMKIAILGWGSLVWDSRKLPISSDWHLDGPQLPIEFSRISKDSRLTLVVDVENGVDVPTRFAESKRVGLPDAVADLRDREGTVIRHIGYTDKTGQSASFHQQTSHEVAQQKILPWLSRSSFDAVVWTGLPSNYKEQMAHDFTVAHAATYLKNLPLSPQSNALEYIRKAPREVETPLRKHLLEERIL